MLNYQLAYAARLSRYYTKKGKTVLNIYKIGAQYLSLLPTTKF